VSNILSQEEIEALLSSLADGDAGPAPAAGPAAAGPKAKSSITNNHAAQKRGPIRADIAYEVYDFRRPDKFSRDQLRTLQMLHETFARLAGSALSAYLRAPVTIDLVSLEQVPYEEYLRSITSSVFAVLSLPPLTGQAVLELEFGMVFSVIDRILGGPGKGINRNVLTDIERPLIRQTLERVFSALKTAWEGVVIVNPGIEGMETSAQFVQIAPPNDIVVTILFEVKIGNQRGAMSICIPYLVLKPITTKLSAQKWFVSNSRKHSPASKRQLSQQVKNANVECTIELGRTELSTQDFLQLKPGDVLRLDTRADREIRFMVGKVPKFQGRPALNGKKIVFSVTQPIEEH
jgi:flagellar motor switch protein FliM